VDVVAAGLLDACAGSLSPTLTMFLREHVHGTQPASGVEDPGLDAAIARICPDHERIPFHASSPQAGAVVFETCGFTRYDLFEAEGLRDVNALWLTWVTHDMLLNRGIPAEVAKPISRALALFERTEVWPTEIESLPGLRLPAGRGAHLSDGILLRASPTQLVFDEQPIATLAAGALQAEDVHDRVISSLYDQLEVEVVKSRVIAEASGQAEPAHALVLALDRRTPFATLAAILYTASRLEVRRFHLVVQPEFPRKAVLTFSLAEAVDPAALAVFITSEGIRVVGPNRGFVDEPGFDHEALAAQARRAREVVPGPLTARIAAEDQVQLGTIVETIAALLGPDCWAEQVAERECGVAWLQLELGPTR
ncbi:MAG: hypothetical protein HC927_11220, partial [Deltaproteobacteria bacterium]|nr:hypothetical protein [Deltaproteobacteria bacterium]